MKSRTSPSPAPVTGIHTSPECDRHPWLSSLCNDLADMVVGRAARELLASADLPAYGAVVVLPTWSWARPCADVGRKDIGYDGRPLRMPIRLAWDCGPVLILDADDEKTVTWHGTGLGRVDTGQVSIGRSGALADDLTDWDGELPETVLATSEPVRLLRIQLTHLAQKGETARWNLITDLEHKYIVKEMQASAKRVITEVTDGESFGLDETTMETLITRFIHGDPGQTEPTPMARILDHALVPSQFVRVDPGRWLTVALRRDTERFIRQYIDDVPNAGPKIRRMSRELNPESMEDLLSAYRERHPADRVAHGRAARALSTSVEQLLARQHLIFEHEEVS